MKIKHIALSLTVFFFTTAYCFANDHQDRILGTWLSTTGGLKVEVFKTGNEYKAKVLWFDDSDDSSKPMETRTDEQNPDQTLRKRKIIGLEVLNKLTYNPHTKQWHHGIIYDANSGREWSSSVSLLKNDLLKVKGYWKFEFIGKSMMFRRIG